MDEGVEDLFLAAAAPPPGGVVQQEVQLRFNEQKEEVHRFNIALRKTKIYWPILLRFHRLVGAKVSPDDERSYRLTQYLAQEKLWVGQRALDILTLLACPEFESCVLNGPEQTRLKELYRIAKSKTDVEHYQKLFCRYQGDCKADRTWVDHEHLINKARAINKGFQGVVIRTSKKEHAFITPHTEFLEDMLKIVPGSVEKTGVR